MLDVKKIAIETEKLMELKYGEFPNNPAMSYDHCKSIIAGIKLDRLIGEQANRQIGWVQACCTIACVATIDEFRELNRRCKLILKGEREQDIKLQLMDLGNISDFIFHITQTKNANRIREHILGAIRTIDYLNNYSLELEANNQNLEVINQNLKDEVARQEALILKLTSGAK